MIQPVAFHSERLSSPRLPICKYCTVVALQFKFNSRWLKIDANKLQGRANKMPKA